MTVNWQSLGTAPKDGRLILLARLSEEGHPVWVALASWQYATLGFIHCASFSGWYVNPFWTVEPGSKRSDAHEGFLSLDERYGPTHWSEV